MRARLLTVQNVAVRFAEFPAVHAFSLKSAGNMSQRWGKEEVKDNRLRFFMTMGIWEDSVISMAVEHNSRIEAVDHGGLARNLIHCDGLITDDPSVTLALALGDCLPIVMASDDRSVVALLHAGWKGADKLIARKAIALFQNEYGITPDRLRVAIGPGIRSCCYNEPSTSLLLSERPAWTPFLREVSDGIHIDVAGYNRRQLKESGIYPDQIIETSLCTCCAKDSQGRFLLFSHHRAKNDREKEGRFLVLAAAG